MAEQNKHNGHCQSARVNAPHLRRNSDSRRRCVVETNYLLKPDGAGAAEFLCGWWDETFWSKIHTSYHSDYGYCRHKWPVRSTT